jgi:hypothetical protein
VRWRKPAPHYHVRHCRRIIRAFPLHNVGYVQIPHR